MKRFENETDEEFEERKQQKYVKIISRVYIIIVFMGMISYAASAIVRSQKKFVRYEIMSDEQEDLQDEFSNFVLKKMP